MEAINDVLCLNCLQRNAPVDRQAWGQNAPLKSERFDFSGPVCYEIELAFVAQGCEGVLSSLSYVLDHAGQVRS